MSALPSPSKEGNAKLSPHHRKSLLEKYTIKPVGTYKSETKLPSLQITHDRKSVTLSSQSFTKSVPTLHRDRMNLLFEDTIDYEDGDSSDASTTKPYIPTGFSRGGLKTPPDIRKAIHDAIFFKALESGPSIENSTAGSKSGSPMKTERTTNEDEDSKKVEDKGDLYASKKRGHSLYFYSIEEKEKQDQEYYLVEEHEEEINHLHDVEHAKKYMGTVATYNPRSTPPLHHDHSSLPTPPSSRAASRSSSRPSSKWSDIQPLSARHGTGSNLARNHVQSRRNSKDPFDISNFADRLYGPHAKENFAERFMQNMKKLRLYPSDDVLPDDMKTPRTMYLRDLETKHRLPLPLILRDDKHPNELKGIYLPNRGIGDEYLLSIISVLHLLPVIENIDLRSNRLTDLSLGPLADKLSAMPNLLYLNLSGNDVDDSSEQIREFIANPNCNLRTFILDNSDVDDIECAKLAEALQENKSITTLSLCHNKIGEMELLNVVMPDLITGGEALGAMLEKNTTLTELDLRWNSIRLNSADVLADSIGKNDTLRVLKLANNAFSENSVELMGRSLKNNECLEELDLSFNNLNPRSMSVLSNSLIHNDTLLKLNVDGCILGSVGTQAFVAAIQRAAGLGRRLEISFNSAECDVHDPHVFNPVNPTGIWELDLTTPYGQMVAEECFFLTNNKIGCDMLSLVYHPPLGPRQKVDIVHKQIVDERKSKFEENQFRIYSKKFNDYLKDQKIPEAVREMRPILEMFSFKITNTLLEKIVRRVELNWNQEVDQGRYHIDDLGDVLMFQLFIALFQIADEDGSGFVSYDELDGIFKLLGIEYENKEDQQRIYKQFDFDGTGQVDIDEFSNAMVQEFCVYNPPKGPLIDKKSNSPWEIPQEGKVVIEMLYEIEKPGLFNVMRNDMMQATLEQLRGLSDNDQRLTVFKHTCNSPYYYMNAGQAQMLFDELYNQTDGDLDLVVEMLPQIIDHHNVIRFLDINLTDLGKLALRIKLGNMYNAYIGNPTGHYMFDLRNRLQRIAAKKLSTLAVSEANYCKKKEIDTSQRGNYSVLRNETLTQGQGHPMVIKADSTFFSHTPYSGKLRFDYASTDRPRTGSRPISNFRLHKLIEACSLDELVYIQDRYNECTSEEAKKILYKNMLKEYLPPVLTIVYLKSTYYEFMETSHSKYDTVIYPKERMRDMSRPNFHAGSKNLVTPRDMKIELDDHHGNNDYDPMFPFAYWKLLLIQTNIGGNYFSCEQVIKILTYFPAHDYIRVQVLLTFFGKLTDLDMLFMIVDFQFTIDEKFETFHRLGILNCLDPIRPEKYYMLDLRRWDHREAVKILVKLAQAEPGDNWIDQKYRWSKYDEEVPGWTLPSTWVKPDEVDPLTGEHMCGPRYDGWLTLTYTSTGKGCSAIYSVRRRLRDTFTLTGLQKLL